MVPKISRGFKVGEQVMVGDKFYIINQYHFACENECDLFETCACHRMACKKEERLDNKSVSFKEIL